MFDIDTFAKKWDARINFPRPTNEQHLSSRRAMVRLTEDAFKFLTYLACALISAYLIKAACNVVGFSLFASHGRFFAIGMALAVIICSVDIISLQNQYRRIFQRETYGSARWADLTHLKSKGLVTPNSKSPLPAAIPIGTFGLNHWLTLPIKMMAKHILVLGPHGSGKTASFFINTLRAWSHVGSALVLDICKNKGEVSRLSAHYYSNVFRFDLVNPECSDRFSLRTCKRNPTLAWEVACLMVGFDPNDKSNHGPNKVWVEAAASLLKCMLLHLNDVMEDPTPGDIFAYIAAHPYDEVEKVDRLKQVMMSSDNPDVHEAWAMFERIDFKIRSSVYFSMSTPLEAFKDPNVKKVMTMPTKEEAARGCRVIDFEQLRKPGTAIYCVVKEGQATRLEAVLGTFFGMAISILRNNADNPDACHVLVSLDENAQVPQRNFVETLTTARGRKMCFMCGYQNISQLETQFGVHYAKAVRQAFLTRIFLPGLIDESADFAVKLLDRTTTFQSSSNDAVGRELDSERHTEVGVDLMNRTELREMLEYTQAIISVDTAHPARIGFPPPAEVVDSRESFPVRYDISYPLTQDAIELYRQAAMTPVEKLINGVRPALLGEETETIQHPSVVDAALQPAATNQHSPIIQDATYSPFLKIPFAPYKGPTAQAAPTHQNVQDAVRDGREEEVIEYTDEIVELGEGGSGLGKPNALAALMQEQARTTHQDSIEEDASQAVLRALEIDEKTSGIDEDFRI